MKGIVWKLLLSAAVLGWCVSNIWPLEDTPLPTHLSAQVTANPEAFEAWVASAEAAVEAGQYSSQYSALLNIANNQRIDIAAFFPQLTIASIPNLKKRNAAVLGAMLNDSKAALKLGLDLKGGVAFTLEATEMPEREGAMQKVVDILNQRINGLGVSEPIIRQKGEMSVEIQLPGVSLKENPGAVDALKKPAKLAFHFAHRTRTPAEDAAQGLTTPPGYTAMPYERTDTQTGEIYETLLYIKTIPEATGEIVNRAAPVLGEVGGYKVILNFTQEGGDAFAALTRKIERGNTPSNVGLLAIVLDGRLYSAPRVEREIRGGSAEITGQFTRIEATELANVLNNPLEVELEVAELSEVGPTLARDARSGSILAVAVGAGLVALFMLAVYGLSGIVALLLVVANVAAVVGLLSNLQATLTLPGIAALVLTIGMAVDASILIFERIREDIRAGKPTAAAIEGGFSKATSTILDANVTTLITASILMWLGTGPVKGFGITLALGIVMTVFCALVLGKALMVGVGATGAKRIFGVGSPHIGARSFNKLWRPAFIISWAIVLVGAAGIYSKGTDVLGIDFLGGDEMTLTYAQPISIDNINTTAAKAGLGEVLPNYQTVLGEGAQQREVLKLQTETGRGGDILSALQTAFPAAQLESIGQTTIGASVSKNTAKTALLAVGVALLGILLYVAIRFEWGYGIGAIIATVHDVLMTLGLFVLLGGQFSAPMVAAILMIVGYSINDTIVVFDRIREELPLRPEMSLKKVMNLAIGATLSRTLLTSVTTLLAAGALLVFGVGVVRDYALIFTLGILTGTFSSIFIASPVLYWWHGGKRQKLEDTEDTTTYSWETGSQ